MSIDYKQLQEMVKEAMFTGGGINEPSAPADVPHRMPAADGADKQQDMGDPEANEKYEIALQAREATEQLVEALDEPIFDGAYEHAFKASACLRRALNAIEDAGAHPMPMQRVVAPPEYQQKYTGGSPGDYGGGAMVGDFGLEEAEEVRLGSQMMSQAAQAQSATARGKSIRQGDTLGGVDSKERGMLHQIEQALTQIAEKDNLLTYRAQLQTVLKTLTAMSQKKTQQSKKKV